MTAIAEMHVERYRPQALGSDEQPIVTFGSMWRIVWRWGRWPRRRRFVLVEGFNSREEAVGYIYSHYLRSKR